MRFINNIKRFIKTNPYLWDCPPSVLLLLFLGITAFVIVTIDLQTEMASKHDEITKILRGLSNSLYEEAVIINNPQNFVVILSFQIQVPEFYETLETPSRAPPFV